MTKTAKKEAFIGLGLVAILVAGSAMINNPHDNAIKVLNAKGYTSVEVGELTFWCGKEYGIRRNFSATDPNGEDVDGKICADHRLLKDKIETTPRKPKM